MSEVASRRAPWLRLLPVLLLLLAWPATSLAGPRRHWWWRPCCKQLERLVRQLQTRVAELEEAARPGRELTVSCTSGERVQPVLDANATTPGRLAITVVGLCPENVMVTRDDVLIQGQGPGDGFNPATGAGVTVLRAHRVDLRQLTFEVDPVDGYAVRAAWAEFNADQLDVDGGYSAISSQFSDAVVTRTSVRNADHAARITRGTAALNLDAEDVAGGIQVNDGASVSYGGTLRNVSGWGISANGHSTVKANGVVENATVGVFLTGSSHAWVDLRISDSRAEGIRAWGGSTVEFFGEVERSAGEGIQLREASLLVPYASSIHENGNHGIALYDQSHSRGGTVSFNEPEIRDNVGFGVFCAPAPAVTQVGGSGFDAALVVGNGLGASNCPTLSQPCRVP